MAPRQPPRDGGQEWHRRERQGNLLDRERQGEQRSGGDPEPRAAPPNGDEPEGEVAEGERGRRDVEAGCTREVVQVRDAEVADGRQRADGWPDPPAEVRREQQERDAGDAVQDVAGVERVKPGDRLRVRQHARPDRGVREDLPTELLLRAQPVDEVVADADVLRLVERQEERRDGDEEEDEDHDGDSDGGQRDATLASGKG